MTAEKLRHGWTWQVPELGMRTCGNCGLVLPINYHGGVPACRAKETMCLGCGGEGQTPNFIEFDAPQEECHTCHGSGKTPE